MKAADVAAMAPSFPWQPFWEKAGFSGLSNVNVIWWYYLKALDQPFEPQEWRGIIGPQMIGDRAIGRQ